MSADVEQLVHQLFEGMVRAMQNGRPQEAERLLNQARATAPRHPLVLNENARVMLLAGNAAGAQALLEQAARELPDNASIWLNLAAASRGLKRSDDEMAALDKVLALEPYHLRARLQKASLQELLGATRAAAATYRSALQSIAPGTELPQTMGPILQHAKDVVDANNRALEEFLGNRLAALRERYRDESFKRFDRCLEVLLHKQKIHRPKPGFMYFPHLPELEFHDRAQFPWLDQIEAATEAIRAELVEVMADHSALEPYMNIPEGMPVKQWKELNRSRRWGSYHLWKQGTAYAERVGRCLRTAAALKDWPRWDVPFSGPTAFFSILEPKTRIPAHCGVSNTRAIVHLPLIVPPGCGFRVGGETREWVPGKAFVFDDSIEHEAWNDSDVPRAVLIFDIWNPFLTEAERALVRELTAGVGEYYETSFGD
jgi:aspartate beta-hydroxylase